MNYCEHYFGKATLSDLTYEDIKTFFSEEQEENETLEFKSGQEFVNLNDFDDFLNKHIIRTIAAFLNSAGGVLIWGSPREQKIDGRNEKVCIGDLMPINISKDKDWLINKISRAISYMPIGIKVERLTCEDKYIYIFEIKESQSKPHQYNHKYFIRLDGQTQDAPHYLVDALFKQITFPDLRITVGCKTREQNNEYLPLIIKVEIDNTSNYINAKQVGYFITTNTGIFRENGKQRAYFNYNGILPKGLGIGESHELLLSQKTLDRDVFIDIQFYSEHSPLKINAYIIKIDPMYKTLIVDKVVENEEAHVTMSMIKKYKEQG